MLKQQLQLNTGERTLLRDSIDAELREVNNLITPEFFNAHPIDYGWQVKRRDRLEALKKRIRR